MAGQTLGFIGIGHMRGPMSGRLLDAGHSLCIFDANPDAVKPLVARGARLARSAAEVASTAETVFLSLPTPPIVQAVTLGENGVVHGSLVRTVIDLSTTGPSAAKSIAQALAECKIGWVDAPVSGGVPGAVKGTLAVMVSAPKATRGKT